MKKLTVILFCLLFANPVWACTLSWDAPPADDEVDGVRLLVKDKGAADSTAVAQPDLPPVITTNCDAYLGKSVAVAPFNQFDQGESTRFIYLGAPGKLQNYRASP